MASRSSTLYKSMSKQHILQDNEYSMDLSDITYWIKSFKFSRPIKNIFRDFSDGTMAAEIMNYYWPKLIDLHNYVHSSSSKTKISNWDTLNSKVLKKFKLGLSKETIEKLSKADENTILEFLKSLKLLVDKHEHEEQLKIEINQNCARYVIDNDEMIQVTGTQVCTKEYLSNEVVGFINKLENKLKDVEHKNEHMSSLLSVKERRIKELQLQIQLLTKS